MLQDFKKFALRGNVVDLAIGVIIGAAFGLIVASMVNEIIMPVIGAVAGGLDFSNYYVPLNSAVKTGFAVSRCKESRSGACLWKLHHGGSEFLDGCFRAFPDHQRLQSASEKRRNKASRASCCRKITNRNSRPIGAAYLSR
jgi:large-conductance mechanosensitive channel MscL